MSAAEPRVRAAIWSNKDGRLAALFVDNATPDHTDEGTVLGNALCLLARQPRLRVTTHPGAAT